MKAVKVVAGTVADFAMVFAAVGALSFATILGPCALASLF